MIYMINVIETMEETIEPRVGNVSKHLYHGTQTHTHYVYYYNYNEDYIYLSKTCSDESYHIL